MKQKSQKKEIVTKSQNNNLVTTKNLFFNELSHKGCDLKTDFQIFL